MTPSVAAQPEPPAETAPPTAELLLEPETILTPPVAKNPIAPKAEPEEPQGTRRWLAGAAADEGSTRPARGAREGGTLFERMSNIARGAAKAEVEEAAPPPSAEGLDLPRFLNRQNNQ